MQRSVCVAACAAVFFLYSGSGFAKRSVAARETSPGPVRPQEVGHAIAVATPETIPLIFVPGFKGSRLVDHRGRTVWVNGLNALGYTPHTLQLPLRWHSLAAGSEEGEGNLSSVFGQLSFDKIRQRNGFLPVRAKVPQFEQVQDELLVDGPLSNISIIPWLFDEDVYGPFLKTVTKWHRPFHVFSYDWRRDNNESAAQLRRFVGKIKRQYHTGQVDVIAHSMGGLLVFSLMNQDDQLFRKIVFAATPFHGGVGFMPDMLAGTATGLNKKILSPEVLFSFPSVYSLFPDQAADRRPLGEISSDALDGNGNPLVIDYFKAEDWRNFKLGLFGRRQVSVSEADFLVHALGQAKLFRDKLNIRNKTYRRAMVILGHKFKTLSYMVRGGPKAIFGWDFATHTQVPGDGRVGANNLPPEYVPYDLYYSDAEHGKILNDPKMLGQIKTYLEITEQTANSGGR